MEKYVVSGTLEQMENCFGYMTDKYAEKGYEVAKLLLKYFVPIPNDFTVMQTDKHRRKQNEKPEKTNQGKNIRGQKEREKGQC